MNFAAKAGNKRKRADNDTSDAEAEDKPDDQVCHSPAGKAE